VLQGKVIVVGAGVGGLSAAIALSRSGLDVTVFERSEDVCSVRVGGGFHIWANAIRALSEVGLAERAQEVGAHIEVTRFMNPRGQVLAEWPCGEIGRALGAPDVGLSRAGLQNMLVQAAQGVDIRAAMEYEGFEQDAEGVTARFADGSEARGAVLIGADGLSSAVRAQLFGARDPDFAGYTQWQSAIDAGDALPAGEEHVVFGPGSRSVMHHIDDGHLFWAAATYGPEGGGSVQESPKAALLERFREYPPLLLESIEATPEAEITGLDIYDRKPIKSWTEGRVTLLGDAAHPMTTNTSQGGNQAIEDGVVLARCLRDAPDTATGLRDYEAHRIPRTSAIVKRSHAASKTGAWSDPVRCRIRDAMMRVVLGRVALKGHREFVAGEL
jgi:2-polyprenyl-6-methoxyphenol hydroxylase-like FAD-dependent oxidoreductase